MDLIKKVCPGSHFDGQGDVSHLPTRLAPEPPNPSPASVPPREPAAYQLGPGGWRRVPRSFYQTPQPLAEKGLPAVLGGKAFFHSQLSPAVKGQDFTGPFGIRRIAYT